MSENMIASVHPSDLLSLKAFQQFGAEAVVENQSVVEKSDVVFVSVKPGVVSSALSDVRSISAGKLFVSIAMGITISDIERVRKYFIISKKKKRFLIEMQLRFFLKIQELFE